MSDNQVPSVPTMKKALSSVSYLHEQPSILLGVLGLVANFVSAGFVAWIGIKNPQSGIMIGLVSAFILLSVGFLSYQFYMLRALQYCFRDLERLATEKAFAELDRDYRKNLNEVADSAFRELGVQRSDYDRKVLGVVSRRDGDPPQPKDLQILKEAALQYLTSVCDIAVTALTARTSAAGAKVSVNVKLIIGGVSRSSARYV